MPGSHSTRFACSWQAIPVLDLSMWTRCTRRVECPEPVEGLSFPHSLAKSRRYTTADLELAADGTFYVGQTRDLRERLRKHQLGLGSKHTHDHVAPRLVYVESRNNLTFAVQRERQIKGWSRAKKAALIRDDGVVLRRLSRSHGQTLKRDLGSMRPTTRSG